MMKLLKEFRFLLENPELIYSELPPRVKYFVDIYLKEMGISIKKDNSEESEES